MFCIKCQANHLIILKFYIYMQIQRPFCAKCAAVVVISKDTPIFHQYFIIFARYFITIGKWICQDSLKTLQRDISMKAV